MSANYGEIICKTVDEIVSAKLQGLSYDITKLCTVVDSSMSHQGKYIVSDGTARYEAYSTDKSFRNGNQVLVQIPNGDYAMQKTIIGRVATTDTTPFNYTPPLDTIIKITNNVFDDARTVYGDNAGLLANGEKRLLGPIYSLENNSELNGYTRLGLSANFRSWLTGLDVASGTYGIKVLIYTDMVREAGAPATNTVYELTFSSTDMIGNPYQFEDYFYQEKVFDISSITNIQKLEVYFYQDSNFLDGNGNQVPYYDIDPLLGSTNKPNNLFVNDVRLYMGYEQGYFTDETLVLHTPGSMTYRYDKTEVKEINLRWIHKIDETNYELLTDKNFDTSKYEIHWFKYEPGYQKIDQYAGQDWKEAQTDGFTYFLAPEAKNQTERVKVVGLIKSISTEEIETASPYFSNILIFNNEELVPDQTTLKASTALSIRCLDNSEGNYLLYDQNGKLINEGAGKGYTRQFKAMYQGSEITEDLGTINWIKWYFPVSQQTMIVSTDAMYSENSGKKSDEEYHYKGTNYVEITRNKRDDEQMPQVVQSYAIDNYWNAQKSNNTIICRVSINGVEYEALEELHFGKAGSNGTNTTFFIEFTGNNNALIAGNEDPVEVRARLYWGDAETASGIPEGSKVKWEWANGRSSDMSEDQAKYAWFELDEEDSSYCNLFCSTFTIPSDNFMILKAIIKVGNYNLEAYLPIPIKTSDCSYMEGAKEVIYNHQGNPSYYDGAYVAYYGEERTEDKEWQIECDEEFEDQLSESYITTLKDMTSRRGYKTISPSPFYAKGFNDNVCVYCSKWSQPILIMQNQYDLAMLNSWNGKELVLEEENGTILSTMLGAGKKDNKNTFSGVLIGDIATGAGNKEANALTGVYGLHEGVISYALKEDGTATFGKNGRGQIQIDGNSGVIKSGDYDSGNGTKINLNSGAIDIQWAPSGRIMLKSNDPYFYINSSQNNNLIKIGDSESFLQSDNFAPKQGTKLDLSTGRLDIRSPESQILMDAVNGPLFKVGIPLNNSDVAYGNSLFLVDYDNYYLQSKEYNREDYIKAGSYNTYKQPDNPIVDISPIVAISSHGGVYSVNGAGENLTLGSIFVFTDKTITIGKDEEGNDITTDLTAEQVKQAYISALFPNTKLRSGGTTKGFQLDLKNSIINGYDLYLKGTNIQQGKSFILDSGAPITPFSIGDNFKVDWDGTLTCNNVNSLNDDGRDDYAISINNNFYVTKSGGAGGGSASFGSGYFGGLRAGSGNVSADLTVAGNLTVGKIIKGKALDIETSATVGNLGVDTLLTVKGGILTTADSTSYLNGVIDITGTFKYGSDVYSPKTITSTSGVVFTVLGRN